MTRPKTLLFASVAIALLATHGLLSAQTTNSIRITALSPTTNGWALDWQATTTGSVYTVQFRDTLQDGLWRVPASPTLFPIASNQWSDPSNTNAGRFYRVVAVAPAERGELLSSNLVETVTAANLALLFNFAGVPITPQYDVQFYKLDYETVTPLGARTIASGALLLPVNVTQALPLVSYQHGTVTQTNLAPSSMNLFSSEVNVGVAFATSGYAAVTPDYLGLGDAPGLHPYHHARSEATACIDLLRAARSFCAGNGIVLTNQLFLCGYSQGGHATMALLRELETYHTNEFTVTACAPMAGAYDLSGVTATNFLSGAAQPNPYYFLYLLAAYREVYQLAPSLASLLASPYDSTLPPLMNGNTPGGQINAAMPSDPVQILKPEYLAAFRSNPRHPLRLALEDNDVYYWRPRSPMRLYHCAGDQDVIIANSEVALAAFQSLGATQVQLIDPVPNTNHGGCSQPSLLGAKAWFDSLR
jgi:pimeloyl-ACP methyl ester carboxylesterase